MNLVLVSKIGDIGVNAFSVISYVASFTIAIFFGTSEGLQPLFGQSYGARNEKDLKFYFCISLFGKNTNPQDKGLMSGHLSDISRNHGI